MTTVKQAIGEIDVVAFTAEIEKDEGTGTWPAGTEAMSSATTETSPKVAIVGDSGETLDLVTVPVEHLEPVEKHS